MYSLLKLPLWIIRVYNPTLSLRIKYRQIPNFNAATYENQAFAIAATIEWNYYYNYYDYEL